MFFQLVSSKYCPKADASLNTLRYKYTLPEIYQLKEFIDIQESLEIAIHKDQEEQKPR